LWYCPDKYKKIITNVNEEVAKIQGSMNEKEAKISLVEFLRANIGVSTEILSGIKLSPYQEIAIKGMMKRNFSMLVFGRGLSKSFSASIFAFLQCIFEPGTKVLIAGPTFRTARNIFNNIEKFSESKGAELLYQCFGAKSRRGDEFSWDINGGSIRAIPLNGEKIRGFRANVLILDEFLLIPEDIIRNVLMPFLVAPQNIKERIEIREEEDRLIKLGVITEEDRVIFPNNSKMVALSSASYTFENLYKTYQDWIGRIMENTNIHSNTKSSSESKYFVFQMGYEAAPPDMIDKNIIEEAQNGGSSNASFLREYCAQFTDGSDSYFSFKKMEECTLKDERPHTLIKGIPGKKYILSIDPNFNESPSADYFAMAVMELDEEKKQGILVHCYAGLGSLNGHVKYLHYLLTNFNIVMMILDNAGADILIDTYNNSEFIKSDSEKIKTFEFDSIAEGILYEAEVKRAKIKYNQENKQIAFCQVFESEFIRRSNEKLQGDIDYKRVWFAANTCGNESFFNESSSIKIPMELVISESQKDWSFIDFLENLDNLIYQTKKQCALVEFSTTARGNQSFELPQHLKRSSSPNRARKDNYTALVLANWLVKCYFDISDSIQKKKEAFNPIMIY
jgi:hypothetical protein